GATWYNPPPARQQMNRASEEMGHAPREQGDGSPGVPRRAARRRGPGGRIGTWVGKVRARLSGVVGTLFHPGAGRRLLVSADQRVHHSPQSGEGWFQLPFLDAQILEALPPLLVEHRPGWLLLLAVQLGTPRPAPKGREGLAPQPDHAAGI